MADDLRILGGGRFLRLVAAAGGWEYVERTRGTTPVGIVALTPENKVLLIQQFRVPVGAEVIEIPAGLVGDEEAGESWEVAAKRELIEETGWEAEQVEKLTEGPPSAGQSSELIMLVRARGLRRIGGKIGVGEENITVHEVPLADADAWVAEKVRAGMLVDPKVYAALYFLRNG